MPRLSFDAHLVDPAISFEPVPEGRYTVIIDRSEMRETRDREGAYLFLRTVVQGGQYDQHTIPIRLNLKNRNAQAVKIAERQLSAICHCVNVLQMSDTEQLHNRRFDISVVVEKFGDGGQKTNSVKAFYPEKKELRNENDPRPERKPWPQRKHQQEAAAYEDDGWSDEAPTKKERDTNTSLDRPGRDWPGGTRIEKRMEETQERFWGDDKDELPF